MGILDTITKNKIIKYKLLGNINYSTLNNFNLNKPINLSKRQNKHKYLHGFLSHLYFI